MYTHTRGMLMDTIQRQRLEYFKTQAAASGPPQGSVECKCHVVNDDVTYVYDDVT